MTTPQASKPKKARHKWVKLRLHVYICKTCGMGRQNLEPDDKNDWRTMYHFPNGTSRVEFHVPPCEKGPRTEEYLAKYAKEIAEWKGTRHAINMGPKPTASEGESGENKTDK